MQRRTVNKASDSLATMSDSFCRQFLDRRDRRAATDATGRIRFRLAGRPVTRLGFSILCPPAHDGCKNKVLCNIGKSFHNSTFG